MTRPAKGRAFTLPELLISVALVSVIAGMTYSLGLPALMRSVGPRSDIVVAGEVNDTVAWLQSAIIRSLETGNDFTLTVNLVPEDFLLIRWRAAGKFEQWTSNRIAFRTLNYDSINSTFTSNFQKMSPALTMAVHYGDGDKAGTGWFISISVYGYVRAFRQS